MNLKGTFQGSLKKSEEEAPIKETDVVADIKEVNAFNMIVDTFENVSSHQRISKSIEGIDSYGKRISDIYDESHRAIQHTLLALANEVDFGNSIVEEARADMERFHMEKTNNYMSHYAGNPLSRTIDMLEKRKTSLSDAISEFENRLVPPSESQNPVLLVQILQEQNKAIIRCSARVAEIQRKTNEIREKLQQHSRGKTSFRLSGDTPTRKSIVETVQDAYEDYLKERKRNLEKRDTKTDFQTKCVVQQTGTSKFGMSRQFGSGLKAQTNTNASTNTKTQTSIQTNSVKTK